MCQKRYAIAGDWLDRYEGRPPLAVFEVEFNAESEAAAYLPPCFVSIEVTANPSYSGAALAGRTAWAVHGAGAGVF